MKPRIIKLLRKSERIAKTDMVYLVGQSGWLIFGQGIALISSLGLAWVFANFVEPSDYGIYRYILTVATIASITTLTGFGIAVARAISQGHNVDLQKIIKIKIRFGLIGLIGMLLIAGYYLWINNTLLATLFAVTAIWIPFFDSLSDYQFVLQGKKHFKLQTIIKIIQRTIITIVVVSAIFLSKNIVIITFTYFFITTLSHYIAYRFTQAKYFTDQDKETPYTSITKYAKHLSIQNIFFIGSAQLDKVLLFKLLGPAQLAVYLFAIAIPNEIQGVLGNINSVAFPKLVDKNSRDFKISLLKKIFLFTLVLLIPVVIYWFLAPYIFKLLFPVYLDSIFISQLFVGTILFIPASLIWHYFYATEHKQALWYGTVLGPSTLIIGILVFVPMYGLIGAVLAVYLRAVTDLTSGLYFFLKERR